MRNLPIDDNVNYQRMVIRRKFILQDAIYHMKHSYTHSKYLRVTFLGEPAVDKGGPIREFFQHLLKNISTNNSIFCGPEDKRCILHNLVELDKRTYYYIGMLLSLSIVYGGPAPKFLAPTLANYIAFGDSAKASISDIPEIDVKEKLMAVMINR